MRFAMGFIAGLAAAWAALAIWQGRMPRIEIEDETDLREWGARRGGAKWGDRL